MFFRTVEFQHVHQGKYKKFLMTTKKSLHVSKKTKTGWRKVDIKDVEDFLEEKRQEERIGTLGEKKDADLFVVDSALSRTARQCLTGRQKRKLNAKRPLRSIQAIENTSKVQDPIVKRNHVKQKKNGRIIEEEVRNPTKPRHFQANKDRSNYHQKLSEKKKGLDFGKDIWEEKDFRDEIPGLKDEKGWVSHKLSLHVAKNIGKRVIKAHDSLRHRTTKAKNIDLPHEGMSYNPSLEAHRDLIEKVVEKEEKIIKTEEHLKRVTTDMFMKVTPEEREQRRLKELAGDVEENEQEKFTVENGNDDKADSPVALNGPVQNKKKTTQVRNKQERHKELLRRQEKRKELKKQLADLMRLKSLKAEVVAEEAKLNELKKHRKKTALKKKFEPKRLSKVKYSEPDIDANMAEDIAGNLRNVKTESNLLIDRFKSLQKRNLLPASVAAPKQKQKKIKRFPRSSHKEELQLQIQ